jgi:peptidoglycan-associated lipoprotein
VTIEGHADERGTNEYNLALGDRRADSAKAFLVDLGIAASRLTTISYGEERPLCMQQSEVCWAKNRRGQFVVN